MYMGVHLLTMAQEMFVLASFAVVVAGIMLSDGKQKATDE